MNPELLRSSIAFMKLKRSRAFSVFEVAQTNCSERLGLRSFEAGTLYNLADEETKVKRIRYPQHCPNTIEYTIGVVNARIERQAVREKNQN